jgi:chromosome segregation ATPase
LKNKLSLANAELDAAYQAARNHAIELSRCKHLNDQLSEQLETTQKDKRRLSEELESTNNHLMETSSRLAEAERRLKTMEAERQQLQNDLDDTRDTLQLEMNKNANLVAAMEKLKVDTDKKIADRDNEIDALRLDYNFQKANAKRLSFQNVKNQYPLIS